MRDFIALHWPLIMGIGFGGTLLILAWVYLPALWGAPYVPSSWKTVKKMLQMAEVQPGQRVVDLGAGDGRIVIAAARLFKAQAVGVEIDPLRCILANALILLLGLRGRARVHYGNMMSFDVSDADVVTLYLLQGTNQALKERLAEQLRPGARIVSHSFSMSGWAPAAIDDDKGIFVYEVGNTGPEVRTRFV